ncbi:hypothetical protein DPMN_027832 [Dreissena polymorpha]|uniref:Uncharacterized protein n=1 Tax=Dreissena polymorpha TaxID=45954 RepID=A0A9D4LU92_DREPO|nr:hypothetical protein DPMN_027829 [Dreissena polymorpha]KAH3864806.1 hypothetical protein DPMN_027832 [Dreissena polymorpha]
MIGKFPVKESDPVSIIKLIFGPGNQRSALCGVVKSVPQWLFGETKLVHGSSCTLVITAYRITRINRLCPVGVTCRSSPSDVS